MFDFWDSFSSIISRLFLGFVVFDSILRWIGYLNNIPVDGRKSLLL